MARMGPRPRYPAYRADIERWCKEGKSDAWIAGQIGRDDITATGVASFRKGQKIFGPRSTFRKYPLDEWFDGEEHTIAEGKDFTVTVASMRAYIYAVAARRRGRATTHVDGRTITFKFERYESLDILPGGA